MRGSALAVLILVTWPAAVVRADLLIVEKMVTRTGDRLVEGERSTYIKGTRMRVESRQGDKTTVTVYDLPAGEMLELEAPKRRATVRTVAGRHAKVEKDYPRQRTTATITPAGSTQNVAGMTCDDHTFAVRVPVVKSGEIAMTLTGSACLAAAAPATADYLTFTRAASDQNLVLGQPSDNYLLLGMQRGQTELYRALATKGIPLIVDMTMATDGKGMLAGIVRRVSSGSRTTAAVKVETTEHADAMFAVPAGWKRENKK